MTYRKCSLMKRTLLMLAMLALAACNTPARIPAPDSDTVDSGKRALEELARLPPAMERVRVGTPCGSSAMPGDADPLGVQRRHHL